MNARNENDAEAGSPFVSTGRLPSRELVQQLVDEAHERYRTNTDGAVSSVYPALERVPAESFAVCLAGIGGNVYGAGEVAAAF